MIHAREVGRVAWLVPSSASLLALAGCASAGKPSGADSDANALLGTVVSVSGTIAAILGGFVLAALLDISAQRNSLSELLQERRGSVAAAQKRLAEQTGENDSAFAALIKTWLRLVFHASEDLPTVADVRRRLETLGLNVDETKIDEWATSYVRGRAEAEATVARTSDQISGSSDLQSFGRWMARFAPDGDPDLLQDAFEREVESVVRRANLDLPTSMPPRVHSTALDINAITSTEYAIRHWDGGPSATAAARMEEDLERAMAALDDVEHRLASLRLPSNLGAGVILFTYIVGSGVVYPLWLMPADAISPLAEFLVKAALVTQVVGIAAYIALLARSIRGPLFRSRKAHAAGQTSPSTGK